MLFTAWSCERQKVQEAPAYVCTVVSMCISVPFWACECVCSVSGSRVIVWVVVVRGCVREAVGCCFEARWDREQTGKVGEGGKSYQRPNTSPWTSSPTGPLHGNTHTPSTLISHQNTHLSPISSTEGLLDVGSINPRRQEVFVWHEDADVMVSHDCGLSLSGCQGSGVMAVKVKTYNHNNLTETYEHIVKEKTKLTHLGLTNIR